MNKWVKWMVAVCLLVVILQACRTTRSVGGTTRRVSANEVLDKMKAAEVDYQSLSAKLKINYEGPEDQQAFKGNLRVIRDSAIWMSVSPLFGLEVARFLITPDSVRFIDRVNNEYLAEPLHRAGSIYNAPVNFRILESLISGNLAFEDLKIKSLDSDSSFYYLSLQGDDLEVQVKINGGSFLADALNVQQKDANRTMSVDYAAYSPVDSQYFSHQRNLQLKAAENVDVSMKFSRVRFNNPVNIVFVVPENYERIR
jgi:outer membrane lipoprotein-sorting protein